jgi:hypothetical protein
MKTLLLVALSLVVPAALPAQTRLSCRGIDQRQKLTLSSKVPAAEITVPDTCPDANIVVHAETDKKEYISVRPSGKRTWIIETKNASLMPGKYPFLIIVTSDDWSNTVTIPGVYTVPK